MLTVSRTFTVNVVDAAVAGILGGAAGLTEFIGAANPADGLATSLMPAPALGDLVGDGDLDLVMGNSGDSLQTFLNGSAGFALATM